LDAAVVARVVRLFLPRDFDFGVFLADAGARFALDFLALFLREILLAAINVRVISKIRSKMSGYYQ
jgi:hypothetical protein